MGKAKKILGAENSRLLMMHAVFILCVSVILGVMNMIGGKYLIGGIIIGVGALTLLFVTLFKNKMKYIVVATTITQIQLILIMAMAIVQHALHGMFPLMLASMAMGGVYFNKKNLLIHWIVMTVVSVTGIFFFDFFYLNSDIMAILKGIVAMNIGAFFIYYLVRFAKTQMDSVKIAEAKSAELLEKVKEQVEQTEAIAADQKRVVEQLAGISETVTDSSNRMKNIAETINNSAAEQNTAINEISGQITQAAEETQTSISESRMASQTALRSKELLNMSAEKIDDMLKAMSEIAEKSEQIQGIVKAIEDIAFQTNILALNASVEAARAGEMGKGFAVVADEVRNLANKSQEAVQNTSELITACIAAVDVGKKMADDVAENMQEVIETANQSAEHARLINEQTKRQAVVISSVNENMSGITDIVNSTAQTAAESMKIAASVAEDAAKMDDIVKNYR